MDSDKGPVVFPLLTLGEVFHVKILSVIFVIISLAYYFSWLHFIDSKQVKSTREKIFDIVFISQQLCPTFYILPIRMAMPLLHHWAKAHVQEGL